MQIIEQTGINPANYNQFIPKEKYNIQKATIQKIKSVITSLNSGIVTKSFENTASTPFDFVINANNMSVIDLAQCYFNIAGMLELTSDVPVTNEDFNFGNLFICSLFQTAALEIGGTTVALNRNPGIDANIQAMMKFDQFDLKSFSLADREFMINSVNPNINVESKSVTFDAGTFVGTATKNEYPTGKTSKPFPQYKGLTYYYYSTTGVTPYTGWTVQKVFSITFDDIGNGTIKFFTKQAGDSVNENALTGINNTPLDFIVYGQDDKIRWINSNCIIPTVKDNGYLDTGAGVRKIPFRCKLYLSDLFNYTVDSLDYIFNRDIKITLNRSAINNIICNLSHTGSTMKTVVKVTETTKFELIAFSYLLTDTARLQLIKAYSQPIETLYGVQTVNLQPLYSDNPSTEQNIVLPLTTTYDVKAIVLAIPKCSNTLQPLSTGKQGLITGQISAGMTGDSRYQSNWAYSNTNDFNYGGLKYIRISNTSNANIYTYDFAGTAERCANLDSLLKSFDFTNVADNAEGTLNDYREAYEQYKNLRLLFGKAPDNGIDYKTFIKDYFIIPIDLTGSNIPPNTRIYLTLQFDNWNSGDGTNKAYNPLHYGNCAGNSYLSTNILAVYFGSNVLTYNPDGSCNVKNVLSVNPNEKQVQIQN